MTLAEKLAAKRAGQCDGVKVKPDPNGDDEYALPKKLEVVGRRVASQDESGEIIPMKHGDEAGDDGWRKACHGLASDLCIVIGPGPKDEAWLALAPEGPVTMKNPPMLLHPLKLLILPGSFDPF